MFFFGGVSYLLIPPKGDSILVTVSKGFITLPDNPGTPIICVGPGTGVAPMRAIIQHRLKLGAEGEYSDIRQPLRVSLKVYLPGKTTHSILAADPPQKTNTTP